jgi:hypothetical protein
VKVKRRAWLLLPVAVIALVLLRQTPEPDAAAKGRDVDRLAGVVRLVGELDLHFYRDENGCRSIDYFDGSFTSDLAGTTCESIDPSSIAFMGAADAAFERVRRSLADTGVGVFGIEAIDAYESEDGATNRQIVFDLVERAVGRWAYVYEPGHEPWPDIPTHGSVEIDDDWYFMAWQPGEQ